MKTAKLFVAAGAIATALTVSNLATADSMGNITAVLTPIKGGSDAGIMPQVVTGLSDKQSCLDLAWVASVVPPGWGYGIAANVSCLQYGKTIAAQTCYKSECKTLQPPSQRP